MAGFSNNSSSICLEKEEISSEVAALSFRLWLGLNETSSCLWAVDFVLIRNDRAVEKVVLLRWNNHFRSVVFEAEVLALLLQIVRVDMCYDIFCVECVGSFDKREHS